jgi:hypothetical protein
VYNIKKYMRGVVMSVTKYRITDEQICAAFKMAGIDEINEIKEISDGHFNSIFSAVDRNGKNML